MEGGQERRPPAGAAQRARARRAARLQGGVARAHIPGEIEAHVGHLRLLEALALAARDLEHHPLEKLLLLGLEWRGELAWLDAWETAPMLNDVRMLPMLKEARMLWASFSFSTTCVTTELSRLSRLTTASAPDILRNLRFIAPTLDILITRSKST